VRAWIWVWADVGDPTPRLIINRSHWVGEDMGVGLGASVDGWLRDE